MFYCCMILMILIFFLLIPVLTLSMFIKNHLSDKKTSKMIFSESYLLYRKTWSTECYTAQKMKKSLTEIFIFFAVHYSTWCHKFQNWWDGSKYKNVNIWNALRDLVLFVQFKKYEKTPMEECCFYLSDIPPLVFFMFLKLYKWYQIAESITYQEPSMAFP